MNEPNYNDAETRRATLRMQDLERELKWWREHSDHYCEKHGLRFRCPDCAVDEFNGGRIESERDRFREALTEIGVCVLLSSNISQGTRVQINSVIEQALEAK